MKRSVNLAVAVVVALLVSLLTSSSDGAGAKKSTEKAAAAKPETYCVVKIGDEVQIVRKSDLAGLKKSTAEEDKKAKKEYDDAKKAAKSKEDKEALGKPPVKRRVIVLQGSLKTEDDAKDWLEKHPQKEGETKPER